MNSSKENSNFFYPSHHRTPYSRPSNRRTDPTVSKILTKPRTSENNYGRSPFAVRNSNLNTSVVENYDEPSTSYAGGIAYDCVDDVYGITVTSCYSKSVRNRSEFGGHFHPRKSQLGNRRALESSFDQPVELKMMTVEDNPDVSGSSKKTNFKTESPSKGFQIKTRQNLLRIFTGSVENLLHWSRLKTGLHILFEVSAIVENIQQGRWKSEKKFYLSDSKSGPKLQVVYHEIDRPLPKLTMNSLVTCVGRLLTRNRLQAYKVEECTEDKKNDLQRLSFICNRVADELATATQKK